MTNPAETVLGLKPVPQSPLTEVVVLEPTVFGDDRGFFFESWTRRGFMAAVGIDVEFVQDNHSRSAGGVLRGIHYQLPKPQGKLVRVVNGSVWDVVVDLRRSSTTFLDWVGVELSGDNKRQLWVPPGFGHGFLTLTDDAEVVYKTSEYYFAEHDRGVRWDDPEIGIDWPLPDGGPVLSAKDQNAPSVADAKLFT